MPDGEEAGEFNVRSLKIFIEPCAVLLVLTGDRSRYQLPDIFLSGSEVEILLLLHGKLLVKGTNMEPISTHHSTTHNAIKIERQELKDRYRTPTGRYQLERKLTGRLVSDIIRCEGGCDACSCCGIEEGCFLSFAHL